MDVFVRSFKLCLIALLALVGLPALAVTDVTGTTPGGALYRIAVPDGWHPGGPLVLLQHGYHHEADTNPDLGPLLSTQLAAGYAVAASGYRQSGWALFTAIEDNAELVGAFTQRFGAPGAFYPVGGSMGGLTALKFAEDPRFRDKTRGVLAFCAVDDGLAAWDFAFDIRQIYDAFCDGTSGELPRGASPYPWALDLGDIPANLGAFDLDNVDLLRTLADVVQCTGIGIPSVLRSGAQISTLAQIQQFTGIGDEDFLLTNLAYATFGLSELLRAPDKLANRNIFFNRTSRAAPAVPRDLAYGNVVLDARIRRVAQENLLTRLDFERSSRPDGSATARIVSIRTSKDELTASGRADRVFAAPLVPLVYPGAGRVYETVAESVPSHCGFTPAELHAGWDTLIAPQLDNDTFEQSCQTRLAQGIAGPCRQSALPESVSHRSRESIGAAQTFYGVAYSSGAWFNPQRDGEGIVIEELGRPIGVDPIQPIEQRKVLVTWYTYAPPGDPNPGPRWLIGLGYRTSQGVHVPSMTITRGARFGAAFNPADVVRSDWGSLSLTIDASRQMRVRYDGPPGWEGSIREMTLLANIDPGPAPPCCIGTPPPPPFTIVSASGAYFDPAHDGEGIQFQLLAGPTEASKRAFVVYYTYDPQGRQIWFTGVADNVSPVAREINFDMTRASGAVFGDTFNPATVTRTPWGTLTLSISEQLNLLGGPRVRVTALRWNSIDPAYGSGGYPLTRLTRVGSFDPREF